MFSTRYCTAHHDNEQHLSAGKDNQYHPKKEPTILSTPNRNTALPSAVKSSNLPALKSVTNREATPSNREGGTNTLPLKKIANRKMLPSNIKKYSNSPKLKSTIDNKQSRKASPIFIVSRQPPPGFRSLSAPQFVVVDVYYQGRFVGIANATTTPNWLRFSHPLHVTNLLQRSLINTNIVQKALTGKLATHTDSLCEQHNNKNCDVLFPKVASVLYDPNSFRAHVFVNAKFKKKSVNNGLQWLPPSTSGFSYINQLYAVSSNMSGKYGYHDYSLYSNNTWAYENMRFNLNGSYVSDLTRTTAFQVDTANFAIIQKQYRYSFGILDTTGNEFFPNYSILGGEFATTLKTLPTAVNGVAIPINIALNFPSQVDVYKDDKLIYSGHYSAGSQSVDTSTFPTGAYPITIKITNGQGVTQELSSYVVKTTTLAPSHLPQYYVIAGHLMSSRQGAAQVFNKPLPISVYQAGSNIRLSPHWGAKLDLLASRQRLFSKIGLLYLQQHWSMRPAFLLGNNGTIGYSGNLNYYHKRFSLYADVVKIWHQDKPDVTNNTDSFLRLPTLAFNLSANYGFNKSNLQLFARLNHPNNETKTYTYGSSFRTELFRKGNATFNLDLSATQSKDDRSMLATISANFGTSPIYGYGSVNYHTDTNDGLTTDELAANGAISWYHYNTDNTGYGLTVNGATEANANDMGANYNYRNNRLQLETSEHYTHINEDGDLWQYGGSLSTHFIFTPSSAALSGGNGFSNNTGVLVEIKSQQPNGVFDVYVNDHLVKHIKANRPVFVSLEPFNQYRISVVNQSSVLYHFSTTEKRVVIYPGNVQKVTWNAMRKYIVVGRLLTPTHRPIENAIIHGGVGYNTTDDNGYFQLETYSNVTHFDVSNHHNCSFIIPQFQAYNIFHYLDGVICLPVKRKHEQK